jgi:hypothetical protein
MKRTYTDNSLTPEQQAVVEEAVLLVPACIKSFLNSMPCLREVARECDLKSAAYMACCRAARTYERGKGISVSAYFSIAIKNGMLREVQKELKSNAYSIMRIPLEQVYDREPPKREANPTAMPSMLTLTETERDWVERFVFDGQNRGGSFRAFGRESGRDCRTAKKMLRSILDKLRSAIEDHPDA